MTLVLLQFDDVCLVAAIAIMEKSELGDQARGNAVYVLRALSRVVRFIHLHSVYPYTSVLHCRNTLALHNSCVF